MRHTTLSTLSLLLFFAFIGCANISDPEITGASLLAYWGDGTSAIDCSGGIEQCVGFARNKSGLGELVDAKRGQGLQLVRLDGYGTQSSTYYAGAWQASPSEHVYEPDIPVRKFPDHHQSHVNNGEMLVHMSVWWNGHRYRIAAVWKPRGASDPAQPAQVFVDLTWKKLEDKIQMFEDQSAGSLTAADKFYLDEIEVYRAGPSNDTFVAAVWRPGDRRTELRRGTCEIATTPIHYDDEEPCPPHHDEAGLAAEACPLFVEVATLHAEQGLRPSDFEPYEQNDDMRLAVLLHERDSADWLMVPGSFTAVHCRQRWLGDEQAFRTLGLLDFDMVVAGSGGVTAQIHNGLVHDGGTGGGGGGSAGSTAVASSEIEADAGPDSGGPGG